MRLSISADIDGVAGVVTFHQTGPKGFEYERARRWMTNEVVAACHAARDCGVTDIVVSDSHGSGENLLLEEFPEGVQIVRSWPRPLAMMQGVETGPFVAAFLLGYHAGAHHEACALIAERTRAALADLTRFKPYDISAPVTLEIVFKGRMQAELLDYLPNVERTGATRVRFIAADMVEASKFIGFVTNYKPD